MKLNDARRLAVRSRFELEFTTAGGVVCVIGRDGVVRIPELKSATQVQVSSEFDQAESFIVKESPGSRVLSRAEVESLCEGDAAHVEEHHDE
jgi:hypothetical protein